MHMSGMFVHADIYETLTEKSYGDSYGEKYEEVLDNFIIVLKEGNNKANMSKEELAIQRWKEREKSTFITDWHRNWYKFRDIFVEPLREGKLKEAFIKYSIFSSNLYSMNRFYFPAMNGEQCGNDRASLILAEKTVEILKNNIKEYDDLIDEEDEDDI